MRFPAKNARGARKPAARRRSSGNWPPPCGRKTGNFKGESTFAGRWSKSNQHRFQRYLIEQTKLPAKYGRELKAALLERWFEADQNGAENWLHARGRISDEIMEIWARTSPQSALREMFGGSGWYWYAPGVALDLLAGHDPKARLALLESLPPTKNRAAIMNDELLAWAKLEPAKAFQASKAFLPDTEAKGMAKAILKRWAKISPAEAAEKAAELFPPQRAGLFGDDFTTEFAREIAQKDPTVAMNFAQSLDPSLQKYPLLAATAGWAKADPVAALAWGYENGLDLARNGHTSRLYTDESVLSEALGKEPEATAQWLLGLPPDAQRDHLLAQACLLQADAASPEQAMTASGTTLAELYGNLSPSEQAQVATELGARVVKDGDFPDLAAWTARFGNGPARAAAIGGAVAKVFEDFPPLADKIIAGLPSGADRDQAILGIMNSESEPTADAAQRRCSSVTRPHVATPWTNWWRAGSVGTRRRAAPGSRLRRMSRHSGRRDGSNRTKAAIEQATHSR